jgi:hypothetical protein
MMSGIGSLVCCDRTRPLETVRVQGCTEARWCAGRYSAEIAMVHAESKSATLFALDALDHLGRLDPFDF